MKKVLLAEDDDYFRSVLKNILSQEGYEVVEAPDGKVAQHLFAMDTLDAVISDIRMPNLDGVALLEWVKKTRAVPFILITGFSELIETINAYERGADEFLPKPFNKDDIVAALKKCMGEEKAANEKKGEQPQDEEGYCKIRIDDFIAGKAMPFRIHIRLSETKFVKIADQGEDLSMEQIRAYKFKGVDFLYMTKEDYRQYVGFTLTLTKAVIGASKLSTEKKKAFVNQSCDIIMERLYVDQVDKEAYEGAKTFVEASISTLADADDLMKLMELLRNHSDFLYAHSLGVSMYGVLLARKMGWHLPQTLFKVAMGGLFHDVGKKELDQEMLKKPRKDFSHAEVQMFESHAIRGMEILSKLSCVPDDVAQIVYQHHEDCLGYGFPQKLRRNRIHPLARLISVANIFCETALLGPNGKGASGPDAIRHMATFHKDTMDVDMFAALMRLFDVDPAQYLGSQFSKAGGF